MLCAHLQVAAFTFPNGQRPFQHTGGDDFRPLSLSVLESPEHMTDLEWIERRSAGLSAEHMSLISAEHMAWIVARVRERCPGATEIRIEGCGDWAVELAKDEATLDVLKAGGATMPEITAQNMNGLLIKYASKGAAALVQLVLQAGANVNHVKKNKDATALIMAAWSGHIDVLRILLDAGAEVNFGNWYLSDPWSARILHETALHIAAESELIDIVRALIDAGKHTDERILYGHHNGNPLMNAAAEGHIDVVRALLDAGAGVNWPDEYDETALVHAARSGHADVVRALIDAGAALNTKTCAYSFGR